MINPPVFRELAAIQEGIDLFPNPNDSNFETCRACKKGSVSRCRIVSCTAQERGKIENLLSEFRDITELMEINDVHDKMESFITLTHCRHHRPKVNEAFSQWKAQRTATPSNSFSAPSSKAMSYSDSQESFSETGNVTPPSPTSELCIREEMKSPKITSTLKNAARKTDDSFVDKIQEQKDKYMKLGAVSLPSEEEQQDFMAIYDKIKNPPHPDRMAKGVLYILEHDEISGIFKIGWSKYSAVKRHKQPSNCYGIDTKVAYETEGGKFVGAFQAERIAHAILQHRKISVHQCVYCGNSHREWFIVSRQEAFAVVKGAESWLQMPAYTLQQRVYRLSPKGESIYNSMCHFSMDEMNGLINNDDESDNASDVFSVAKLATAVEEISAPNPSFITAKNGLPRGRINESYITTLPMRQKPQKTSPAGTGNARRMRNSNEANGLAQGSQIRTAESDPNVEYDQVAGPLAFARKQVNMAGFQFDNGIFDLFESIDVERTRELKISLRREARGNTTWF